MFGDKRRQTEFTAYAASAQQRLFRQGYLLTGSREAAQDLVQTTLTKMYVAWPRIDNPPAYAYRTMMRGFLEVRRRSERERQLHDFPTGRRRCPTRRRCSRCALRSPSCRRGCGQCWCSATGRT